MTNAVCMSCSHFNKDNRKCLTNMPLAPYNRDDCWRYKNKYSNHALSENSKGNPMPRMKGTWQA